MPEYKDVSLIIKEIEESKKNLHFKNAENAEICAGVLAFVQGVIDRVPEADVEPVVTCKDCKYNGLHTCPIAYIEKQTLQFVNHDPDFWCAKGELKKDGEK